MSIDRWMDKEVVVHTYNRILLSHKSKWIWVSWTEVDEPRVKPEREKKILCINAHICNLLMLLERKGMTNLDSLLKSRHYFANKGASSQSYGFSRSDVWMWELEHKESWVPKDWCFGLWCWRRLLRVPWAARRSNQSTLKEISPGCSLEGLMLKLKLQTLATWCEELTHWKRPWCWERLRAGGEGDDRGWGWDGWMASPTRWTLVWVDSGSWYWTGRPGMLQSMGS